MRHLRWMLVGLLALAVGSVAPTIAHAGLEFCFTPECSDGNPCTCDFLDEEGVCQHDPRTRWASAARASGLQVNAFGKVVVPPTPDSNKRNPDEVASIPAAPLAHVDLLHVEEIEENRNGNTESYGLARVTTGAVRILDQGGENYLVTADAIQTVSESIATNDTATSSGDGSTLTNVVVNGVPLGDVSEPMDLSFQLPALNQRVDVRLLQTIRVGGAAGDPVPDPEFGVVVSGITVNGIRVTVRDYSDPARPKTVADVIVARADTRVDRFSPDSCGTVGPRVSGSGFVFNLDLDEAVLDPDRQAHRTRIGEVVLPSTGGEAEATLSHVGPILDPSGGLLIESNTAFSRTHGVVDRDAGTADAATETAIEDLDAFDLGAGAQIQADSVRAECTATAGDGVLDSRGQTTLVGLEIAGENVCAALGLEDPCTPEPNTELASDVPGVRIVLNEQIPDPESDGATGITVNAIHVRALGAGNGLGIPLAGDVIVSRAHCDAFAPGEKGGAADGSDGTGRTGGSLGDLSPGELQTLVDSILGMGGDPGPGLVADPLGASDSGAGLLDRVLGSPSLGGTSGSTDASGNASAGASRESPPKASGSAQTSGGASGYGASEGASLEGRGF